MFLSPWRVSTIGARALINRGYEVVAVDSGEAAIGVLQAGDTAFDIMITDVIMPGFDGPGLIRKVHDDFSDLDMKVVFISGYTEDSFRQRLGHTDAIHFLPKPFTLQQLVGKVKEIMDDDG